MKEAVDRLVDSVLCEIVGNETPPDLTSKILARAASAEIPARKQRTVWFYIPVAAAALLAMALTIWFGRADRYPSPQASGAYTIAGGGEMTRGATLVTDSEAASITLGGYCTVTMAPESSMTLAGSDGSERVVMGRGGVTCEVSPGVGGFAVETKVGVVSVVGTEFNVRLSDDGSDGNLTMAVSVSEGVVRVESGGMTSTLEAGGKRIYRSLGSYPGPEVSGVFFGNLTRGSEIKTGGEGIGLTLGGYCRVSLRPWSRAVWLGDERNERMRIEDGQMACTVEKGKAIFTLETSYGTASTSGGSFIARSLDSGAVEITVNDGIVEAKQGERPIVMEKGSSVVLGKAAQ